jgi:hypothetical protein
MRGQLLYTLYKGRLHSDRLTRSAFVADVVVLDLVVVFVNFEEIELCVYMRLAHFCCLEQMDRFSTPK